MVNPIEAIRNAVINYFNFTGRSTRAEFWWWTLFTTIIFWITTTLDNALGLTFDTSGLGGLTFLLNIFDARSYGWISLIFLAFIIIPNLALTVRRLRDAGRYWFWLLITITGIGGILIFVFEVSRTAESGWGVPTSQKNPSITKKDLADD